jgi:large subunit ribosomal protein L25
MAKALVLKAQKREQTGSKSAAKVRKQGRIPAVIYGHKKEAVAISLDRQSIVEGVHHGHRLIDVQIGKKREKMLIKDLQYDYLGKDVIHVDLMRVDES